MIPRQLAVLELAVGIWPSLALRAAVKTGCLDRLGQGPCTPAELACELRLDAGALRRVLRLLAGYDVVREGRDGRFSLTRLGARAVRGSASSAAAFIEYVGEPWQLQPWENLEETLRTGEPAFNRIYGTTFFEYIKAHPEAARVFDAAMSSATALRAQAVVSAYNFTKMRTVADIGGGNGLLLSTILEANPQLHGILLDMEQTLDHALPSLLALGERVQFITGNFFERIETSADIYILSSIICDWDDEAAARILRNVRASMPAHARILIVECILESGSNLLGADKLTDLQMLTLLGGRIRSREEFEQLLAACDLRLRRVLPTIAPDSILEAVAA